MQLILSILSVLKIIGNLIDKFYDEYIRTKYRNEGAVLRDTEAQSQISADQVVRKEIAAKVDLETEDETNAGLIDPRK